MLHYGLIVLLGLAGLAAIAVGIAWCLAVVVARRVFERALNSVLADIVRLQAVDLIEQVKNPLLRRIVNRGTGEYVGNALVDFVREDLWRRLMIGLGIIAIGVMAIAGIFFVP